MANRKMRVLKYIPSKLFGFLVDDSGFEVFFHLGSFRPGVSLAAPAQCGICASDCPGSTEPPPPILGEAVNVECDAFELIDGKAPRANRVDRIVTPQILLGTVDTFDAGRGFGFCIVDGVSYHLHRSEITDGRMPLPGGSMIFFAGIRHDKPRACHVRMCR